MRYLRWVRPGGAPSPPETGPRRPATAGRPGRRAPRCRSRSLPRRPKRRWTRRDATFDQGGVDLSGGDAARAAPRTSRSRGAPTSRPSRGTPRWPTDPSWSWAGTPRIGWCWVTRSCTPHSSRFWPAEQCSRAPQPSYDKQFGGPRPPPAGIAPLQPPPAAGDDVVEHTSAKHVVAHHQRADGGTRPQGALAEGWCPLQGTVTSATPGAHRACLRRGGSAGSSRARRSLHRDPGERAAGAPVAQASASDSYACVLSRTARARGAASCTSRRRRRWPSRSRSRCSTGTRTSADAFAAAALPAVRASTGRCFSSSAVVFGTRRSTSSPRRHRGADQPLTARPSWSASGVAARRRGRHRPGGALFNVAGAGFPNCAPQRQQPGCR